MESRFKDHRNDREDEEKHLHNSERKNVTEKKNTPIYKIPPFSSLQVHEQEKYGGKRKCNNAGYNKLKSNFQESILPPVLPGIKSLEYGSDLPDPLPPKISYSLRPKDGRREGNSDGVVQYTPQIIQRNPVVDTPTRKRNFQFPQNNAEKIIPQNFKTSQSVHENKKDEEEGEYETESPSSDSDDENLVLSDFSVEYRPYRRRNTSWAPLSQTPESLCSSPYVYVLKISHKTKVERTGKSVNYFSLSLISCATDYQENVDDGVELKYTKTVGKSHYYSFGFKLTSFKCSGKTFILKVMYKEKHCLCETKEFLLVARKIKKKDDQFWGQFKDDKDDGKGGRGDGDDAICKKRKKSMGESENDAGRMEKKRKRE